MWSWVYGGRKVSIPFPIREQKTAQIPKLQLWEGRKALKLEVESFLSFSARRVIGTVLPCHSDPVHSPRYFFSSFAPQSFSCSSVLINVVLVQSCNSVFFIFGFLGYGMNTWNQIMQLNLLSYSFACLRDLAHIKNWLKRKK